jgi:hypothetical protein
MAEKRDPIQLLIRDCRMAFPALWEPYENSYGIRAIIPKNHPQIPELKKLMMKAAVEKWGTTKGPANYKALEASDKLCLHNGDSKAEYEGFEGNLFVAANNKNRPSTWDGQRNPVAAEDGVLYSGCYINASIEIWCQDNKQYGKRINASLRGVQFLRKGDAFSGGAKAAEADEFDEIDAPDETGDDDMLG